MAGVWIIAETPGQATELLGVGRELADGLGSTLALFNWEGVEAGAEPQVESYAAFGVDQLFVLLAPRQGEPWEACVPLLAEVAGREDPDVILVAATQRGKEIAARLATRLGTGLCSGCIGLELEAGSKVVVMERLLYGGAAVQKVVCPHRPQMASVPPRTFAPPSPRTSSEAAQITRLEAEPPSPVKVESRAAKTREAVDITEAKVVVCVGRGVAKEADLGLARQLAEVLGGEVACSRPIAEELKWLPEDLYLGISGKKVSPQLYVGVGISGQIQHVSGIRGSRVILAVNRDENAPIFEAADYGIVGDLYQVVPALVEEFETALTQA